MIDAVTVTFALAAPIAKELASGIYERYGGVIRDAATKQVVAWLRECSSNASQVPTPTSPTNLLNLVFSQANMVVSVANLAVSGKGLADVNQRLGGIEQH